MAIIDNFSGHKAEAVQKEAEKLLIVAKRARLIFVCSNQAEVLALAPNNEVCVVDDLSTGRVENLPIASGIE